MYSLLSSLPFGSHLVIHKGQQTVETPTWSDVFTFLQSAHFHAESGRSTPHTESLWEHLTRAGDIAYEKAIDMCLGAHEAKKAYFAAFLHDIGKPATLTRSSTHLAFKGHGLVGGAILENAWTPGVEAATGLTAGDWADISMLADVHMCGYFPDQCTYQHAVGFQMLPESVKRILPCLRWSDMAAMTPTDPQWVCDPAPDEERFLATLSAALDMARLAKEKPRGILIQLCGASGAGKSSLARWLVKQFESRGACQTVVVSRDTYMVQATLQRLRGPDHVWDGSMNPELYQECYSHYVGTGKAYAADINAAMKTAIAEALRKSYIVILDTLMTMYVGAVRSVLPEAAEKAFRLNLWVHRNCLITEEEAKNRLGITLDEQLAVTGDTGMCWNPFPAGLQWRTLVSATE